MLQEVRVDIKNLVDLYDEYGEAISRFCSLKNRLPKEIKEQSKNKNK